MKYVLTGGPGIGKTTVIEILASRGYEVVPEAARMIVEEQQAENGDIFPWTNLQKFQGKAAERQIELEKEIKSDCAFLDRGLVDGYGYSMLGGVPASDIVMRGGANRYKKIFILEPLSSYENDHVRMENQEEAQKIHEAILEAYKHFNYDVELVPVMLPEERVDYILSLIN